MSEKGWNETKAETECDCIIRLQVIIERQGAELKKAYGRITALSLKEGRTKIADVYQQQKTIIDRQTKELKARDKQITDQHLIIDECKRQIKAKDETIEQLSKELKYCQGLLDIESKP